MSNRLYIHIKPCQYSSQFTELLALISLNRVSQYNKEHHLKTHMLIDQAK